MKLRWTTRAAEHLEKIAIYISHDKPDAAAGIILKIIESAEQLAEFPALGRPGRKHGTRELIVAGTPFIIVYRQTTAIEILSVFHSAMLPEKYTAKQK